MEIISTETIPVKKKKSLIWKISIGFFTLLLAFSLGYFAVSFISAQKSLKTYNHTYGTAEGDSSSISFVPYNLSFLEARYSMSKTDSISLLINLNDSVALLELGGVKVFDANLQGSTVSPILKAMKPEALSNLLRTPARVSSYHATIEKQTIVIKKAPRDTTEAAMKEKDIPEAAVQTAFFTLILDSGIRIVVMPHEEDAGVDRFVYIAKQNLDIFRQRLSLIFKGSLPEYVPFIIIEVSADDAKTLFRSLPDNAQVAIKL